MTKEQIYLNHKKEILIKLVDLYNKKHSAKYQFSINNNDLDIEKTFCTSERCKKCGGCCSKFPCAFSPDDFLDINDLEYMRKILDSGVICITKSHYKKVIILRPRGEGDLGIVSLESDIEYNYHGYNRCLLKSDTGCLLSAEYRPSEGLLYLPLRGLMHQIMYSETDIENDYEAYQESLEILFNEYLSKNISVPNFITKEDVDGFTKSLVGYKK